MMSKEIIDNDVPADALIYGPLPSKEAAHELHGVMSDLKQFDNYGRIAETETGWICWISPKHLVKYTLGGNQIPNEDAKLELRQVTRAFLSGWNLALKPIREAEELRRRAEEKKLEELKAQIIQAFREITPSGPMLHVSGGGAYSETYKIESLPIDRRLPGFYLAMKNRVNPWISYNDTRMGGVKWRDGSFNLTQMIEKLEWFLDSKSDPFAEPVYGAVLKILRRELPSS